MLYLLVSEKEVLSKRVTDSVIDQLLRQAHERSSLKPANLLNQLCQHLGVKEFPILLTDSLSLVEQVRQEFIDQKVDPFDLRIIELPSSLEVESRLKPLQLPDNPLHFKWVYDELYVWDDQHHWQGHYKTLFNHLKHMKSNLREDFWQELTRECYIELSGVIDTNGECLEIEDFLSEFTTWIESKGWYFGGGAKPLSDE